MEFLSEKNSLFLSSASFWKPEWLPETSAWLEHAPFAFWLVGQLHPGSIVELGTHAGYSMMAFCQAVKKYGYHSQCAAVDTWLGDSQAGFYGNEVFELLQSYNRAHYGAFCRLIRSKFDEARLQFTQGSIDLLHIDGLHTYEAVKHDFETWLPCVSKRGIVLFHDIAVHENNFGVWQLWAELRKKYPHFEFLHGYGLGVLGVGDDLPDSLRQLFTVPVDSIWAGEIRDAYERLGKTLQGNVDEPEARIARLEKKHALKEEKFRKKEEVFHKQIGSLRKIIQSAQDWQRHSWVTRAFHKWRAPALPVLAGKSRPVKKKIVPNKTPTSREKNAANATAKLLQTVFHADYYLERNPVAAVSDLSPLEHYRTIGWKENFNPHPLFDVAWYRQQNPTVGGDPLEHYLEAGWKEGCAPHLFFDPHFYLAKYPDVRVKNREPLGHYVGWGWKRDRAQGAFGRSDWLNELPHLESLVSQQEVDEILGSKWASWLETKDAQKPVILLVTHTSNRTGAPIIILNLAQKLREKYHILLLDLREDSLQSDFQKTADYYIGFGDKSHPRLSSLTLGLHLLLSRCPIHFAVVNSICSTRALPVLAQKNVPVVHLIHEFPEFTRHIANFRTAIIYSGISIFPSQMVRESARRVYPELKMERTRVLPQGLCVPPSTPSHEGTLRIARALRPAGWENAIVILGMGTVDYRKGVDLFFLCAAHLIKHNPAGKVRFVWFGAGYTAASDDAYGVSLTDQLQKIPIRDAVDIFDAITDVAVAYAGADLLFISSRKDPFPLVAQEAMQQSLPVLCFDEATGTAEVLSTAPETSECVIPYLDVETACRQMQKLIDNPDLRKNIGRINQQLAENLFDFEKYAGEVERVALQQIVRTQQEVQAQEIINKSGVLNRQFLRSTLVPEGWFNPTWWYVRSWAAGIYQRKPFAGFHPGIYAEKNQLTEGDPLVHYLQTGKPAGPWNFQIITPSEESASMSSSDRKIALHIHLFYADMAQEILTRLQRNQTGADLWITVPDEAAASAARIAFSNCKASRLEVIVVPNRGRDIGPFLTALGAPVFGNYDVVGHLHTKKSLHSSRATHVELWTNFLFENHLGGQHAMMDRILAAMEEDPQIGMVFPDDPSVFSWGKNQPFADKLANQMGWVEPLPKAFNFSVGTFFWARPAALKKLFDLQLQWEDYPEEPVEIDGTMLHALERLLPIVVEKAGYRSAVSYVPGLTR